MVSCKTIDSYLIFDADLWKEESACYNEFVDSDSPLYEREMKPSKRQQVLDSLIPQFVGMNQNDVVGFLGNGYSNYYSIGKKSDLVYLLG